MDEEETCIMLDWDTYQQYLNLQKRNEQKKDDSQKVSGESSEQEAMVTVGREYINQIRFSTAYTLLVSTDMSIPDILDYIGIEGKSYFYREFQKLYHVTPIKLRKSPQIRRD